MKTFDFSRIMKIFDFIKTMKIFDLIKTMKIFDLIRIMKIFDLIKTMKIFDLIKTMKIFDLINKMKIFDLINRMNIFNLIKVFETNSKFGFQALETPPLPLVPSSVDSHVRSKSGTDPGIRSRTSPPTIVIERSPGKIVDSNLNGKVPEFRELKA
jgi:hypothetical protein